MNEMNFDIVNSINLVDIRGVLFILNKTCLTPTITSPEEQVLWSGRIRREGLPQEKDLRWRRGSSAANHAMNGGGLT